MQTISTTDRRQRLATRHRLCPASRVDDDVAAIARAVVVLHATDPGTVVLSLLARMHTPDLEPIERALYEDRTVLRMLGMRRTVYTVSLDVAPVVHASSTLEVLRRERKKLVQLLQDSGVAADGEQFLGEAELLAMAAVAELGEVAAADLSRRVPALGVQMAVAEDKSYAGRVGVSSKVLFLLAAEGRLGRDRPRGLWTGSQHRWAPITRWFPDGLPTLDVSSARADLLRRWLGRFGPGTVADMKWWTGWTLGQTRAALRDLDIEEVDLDGVPGLVLAGDLAPSPPVEPWVALLPGLDPTTMGWRERGWYLPDDHRPVLFDPYGNAGPTVWVDGLVVGGWAQRATGEVVHRLLEDVGSEQARAVEAEAARLQDALGALRVVPRFRSPLHRELAA